MFIFLVLKACCPIRINPRRTESNIYFPRSKACCPSAEQKAHIQLFHKTLSKEKRTSHKPRPQGSMGSFKLVFIAAVKRELKKPRRRPREQRLQNELMFYVRISRYPKAIYFVYLCPSYHETESKTHQ